MTQQAPLELEARKMIAGGDALAHQPDGRAVLLRGALPGERVLARITESKRGFRKALTLSVTDAAPERRAPPCDQVEHGCGGCDWQHVDPAAQLQFKVAIVEDALRRTARIDGIAVRPGARVTDAGYRTTLRLALDRQGRPGFRGMQSHRIVTTGHCHVAHPGLAALLPDLLLPGASDVVLRIGARTGERLAWWRSDKGRHEPEGPERIPRPAWLPEDIATGPGALIHEIVDGVRFQVSAASFFQSSPEAAEYLVDAVRRAAGDPAGWGPGPIVDAYGGVGLFAATVGSADRPVLLVESNPGACRDATVNLAERDARIVASPLERWQPVDAGLVIANPARSGLDRVAVTRLAATRSPRLVLVSCDPVAFARDARLLTDADYRLDDCEVLDLFPNTHHLEVVSSFLRC